MKNQQYFVVGCVLLLLFFLLFVFKETEEGVCVAESACLLYVTGTNYQF